MILTFQNYKDENSEAIKHVHVLLYALNSEEADESKLIFDCFTMEKFKLEIRRRHKSEICFQFVV